MPTAPTSHWSGTGQLRGGAGGIKFFVIALRVLGLRLTYALMVPPAIYFSFASPDIATTMDYHRRIYGRVPWWKRRWLVFRHFLSFGRALVDRTAILSGNTKDFSFSFDNEHHLRNALAEGHGVLLLSAHFGNWEAAGQLLSRLDAPVTVTGFDHEVPAIRSVLDHSAKAKFRLLPLTGSPTDTIPLVAALRRGEIVAMLGDRPYGSPAMPVPFMGSIASFPVGAYVMAAIARAPLIHVFSQREPGGHYRFVGFPPQYPEMPPRNQRDQYLRDCATRFAIDLESIVKRDPLQWYNFFPFWAPPPARADTPKRGENSPSAPLAHDVPEPINARAASPSPGGEGRGDGAHPTDIPVHVKGSPFNSQPSTVSRTSGRRSTVNHQSSSLNQVTSIPIEKLIPHRPPMQWINALLSCTDTAAVATACFKPGDFPVVDGSLLESALVECVAQTVAAALGSRGRSEDPFNRKTGGVLAAVSNFRIESPPPLGKTLRIEVRELKRFGPMLLVSGVISCEGRLVASGELTLNA